MGKELALGSILEDYRIKFCPNGIPPDITKWIIQLIAIKNKEKKEMVESLI